MQKTVHHAWHILFCVFVQMARAVMEAFPALPGMSFGTSKKEMACERWTFALSILNGSGLFFPLFFIFTLIFKYRWLVVMEMMNVY